MKFLARLTHARRVRGFLFLGVVLAGLAGCNDEGYPANLQLPLRSDPLITETPTTEPKNIDRPGELPQILNIYLDAAERGKQPSRPDNLKTPETTPSHRGIHCTRSSARRPSRRSWRSPKRRACRQLGLDDATLQEGSRLYRQHCLHCHGLTGDGRGPTAPGSTRTRATTAAASSSSRPRRSTSASRPGRGTTCSASCARASSGTSMPSFRLLPDHELEAVASYVTHLSLRAEQVEEYATTCCKGKIVAKRDRRG